MFDERQEIELLSEFLSEKLVYEVYGWATLSQIC